MSVARGFGLNGKSIYANVCKLEHVYLNFIVDAANGNGLGVRSVKSNGYVDNVFMHTSAAPGINNGKLNPNPANGVIMVQFKNNFNKYLGGTMGFVSPVSGSPLTATVAGTAYVIVSLGTATLAQWQAVGLTPGIVPAVGVAFVANATATIGGAAAVETSVASGIVSFEVVGNSDLSLNNSSIAKNAGGIVILQAFNAAGALAAPGAGSAIGGVFWFDGSSVSVDGL